MLCAMVMPLLANAQENTDLSSLLTYEDGVAHFSEVMQVNGATADNLYRNAIMWINATFNNPHNVLHTDNKELGLLTIKSAVGYPDILMTHFIRKPPIKCIL